MCSGTQCMNWLEDRHTEVKACQQRNLGLILGWEDLLEKFKMAT